MPELASDRAARHLQTPVDAGLTQVLAAQGLDVRVVTAESDAFAPFFQAWQRGFLEGEPSEARLAGQAERVGYRRFLGVYDAAGVSVDEPIATFSSWPSELTLPGERALPAYAISTVTVAATHHRRGIARAMVEGELRTAAALGYPVAVLTATEATLYGRYGFAPAAVGAQLTVHTRRAGWLGGPVAGRIDYVSREHLRAVAPALHERVRLTEPGEVIIPDAHWDAFAGTRPDADNPGKIRALQYRDADGVVQGLATYSIGQRATYGIDAPRTGTTAEVGLLLAATPDAYTAIWRFLLELDLVDAVRVGLRGVDEPIRWLVADQRAIEVSVRDHQYVRLLDVPAALAARTYSASGAILLYVTDAQGFASGRWFLTVDDAGVATVTGAPTAVAAPSVTLSARSLGALFLGGVSARTLRDAGQLTTDDVDLVDDLFRSRVAPRLSFWY